MAEKKGIKKHFHLRASAQSEPYTPPPITVKSQPIPPQERKSHGASLMQNLSQVRDDFAAEVLSKDHTELSAPVGIQVEFESFPELAMNIDSLADARQKIELLNVIQRDDKTLATIFVPEGKLDVIEKKIISYIEEKKTKQGRPQDNSKLIDTVKAFRTAVLESLWTDSLELLPENDDQAFWWEVWMPVRGNREQVIHDFRLLAEHSEIKVSHQVLEFPESSVLVAFGSKKQFQSNSLLLNCVSELRKAKETADFFTSLMPEEENEWISDLKQRLEQPNPSDSAPFITIMDTGVNNAHPLLSPFITENDQFKIKSDWVTADEDGHGTGMAGLALWGDLSNPLASGSTVSVGHYIESVKLLRHSADNVDEHLGVLTANAVSYPEIVYPHRTRVHCMAVTAKDSRDRGKPSAWSAEIDSLAVDYLGENETRRLFFISAGNTDGDLMEKVNYPTLSVLQGIHDPGQAWNAITVGAYTEKYIITESDVGALQPLAPKGALSPHSTTSFLWDKTKSPFKPEVVFEGGNLAFDNFGSVQKASLDLLTTYHDQTSRLLTTFCATSSSTALASKFAAEIYCAYPSFWPETVRGLIIHSADWTQEMVKQFNQGTTERLRTLERIKAVGFGVPNLERALWSASNSLSMIIEDAIQPFDKLKGKDVKTRDMHLHDLPWPKEALAELGEVDVEMSVTLSYFIEPNPSSRIVSGKYSYQSYGLRFDVKRAVESVDEFRKRINRQARDEEEGTSTKTSDPNWIIGPKQRHRGSVHKDVWKGKAVDLASRGTLAVYPAMGWWKTRTRLERFNKEARYSLIVSIKVADENVDIYSEVSSKIKVEQLVTV